jgi:drug/metabolite transporter (DMT)-like permease
MLQLNLAAESIVALYVVFARWGIGHGAGSIDLTALRFGIASIILLPLFVHRFLCAPQDLTGHWRVWLAVSFLAGTPFGILISGALQLAPASHVAVFPFAAMSIMGMVLGAVAPGDRMTLRRLTGIGVVLVLVSSISAASFSPRGLVGDAMFLVAGTFWSGFGILLHKHRLDPVLATAVIAFSALATFVPVYLWQTGGAGLLALGRHVLLTEALVQGVVAGVGTLLTYAAMVKILGPARAAIFPALAPGLATLITWPMLGMVPGPVELIGLATVIAGLLWAVSGKRAA